ncbi:Gldg family protein [Magnetospira sp. QH-2]|uniref:Gldg family protein n=1 Tax=Magnetospira sp. (strain QH-2) TaxID=1288970 RepID=UPI0003E81958|nr:Gldg family protein [Magnetospira sp. QH-2]CCQ75587.1 conserved exported protein of unknown function[Include ABC-type uncharacterized transport system domain] [Magnetospira sp. QH-2]
MRRATHMDRTRLAILGLLLGAIILMAVNVFSNVAFRGWRLDLTEDRLYTLAPSTHQVLADIDEPVRLRLYYSDILTEAVPGLTPYYRRIRELLEHYRDLSGGRVILEIIHPQPFSDDEDRAVAAGLQGLPVNDAGDLAYFGLEGTNAVDGLEVVPFFSPEREAFIEYDLTRMVHVLSQARRPVIGLISTLPLDGGVSERGWVITDLMREFFEVRNLGTNFRRLDPSVDLLMVVHPRDLPDRIVYAIDQFVLGGGRALVFVDAHAERGFGPARFSDFNQLLKTWGLRLRPGEVAGDRDAARRVSTTGSDGRAVVSDYVAWLTLEPEHMDSNDAVTGDLKTVNIATAGILEALPDRDTRVTPVLHTSNESMALSAAAFMEKPDVVGLFRDFRPQGQALMIGARVDGEVSTAFPGGPPEEPGLLTNDQEQARMHLDRSASPINVMVFSDTDMLDDRFWVRLRDLSGQRLMVPFANNGDLVVNALENLSGGSALAGLRARGRSERPFKRVEEIRQRAEMRYRANEQTLLDKLKDLEAKVRSLSSGEGGGLLLSAADRLAVEKFRGEMVATRKALRNVQHVLRRDIEALDSWLKFANIIAMPLLVGVIMLGVVWSRQRRSSRRRLIRKAEAGS